MYAQLAYRRLSILYRQVRMRYFRLLRTVVISLQQIRQQQRAFSAE